MPPILPGATLGILGGGQLGRMTAMAARPLGYKVHVLDPDPDCAARRVVERCVTAGFDDAAAAEALARGCDVVTLEIEKIALPALAAAARAAPLRPAAGVLEIIQDRGRQKAWLAKNGFPLGPWREARSAAELAAAARELGAAFVKSCHGGYDGRGQFELARPEEADAAWRALGEGPCVVERRLRLDLELSVMVARRPSGETAVYPPALNHHEARILAWNVLPAPIAPDLAREAEAVARAVADAMAIEGLLAIELFVVEGRLLVNELAPRPHNSYHASEVACATSQFEQHVRAVCDLPLGSTEVFRPAAIVNLLGDLWLGARPPAFERALAIPGVRLHLYGKGEARPGRKMGHLSASAPTAEAAIEKALEARARLGG